MPTEMNLPLIRYSDGVLQVAIEPSVPIGGWQIRLVVTKRFGGMSGLIEKDLASGYGGGESGITVVDSGLGIISARFGQQETSGWDAGNYAISVDRIDSGFGTPLVRGYVMLDTSILR